MSTREMINSMIDGFTDEQLKHILVLLSDVKRMLDEADDDAFCEELMRDYLNDTDPEKNDAVSLEEFITELGIELE